MADGAGQQRHALQFRGQVKSFSSKDILAQLAAAQQPTSFQPAAAPPGPASAGRPFEQRHAAEPRSQAAFSQPTSADPKAGNFHALQYKGSVKKFTSDAVRPRCPACLARRPPGCAKCALTGAALARPAPPSHRAAQVLHDFTRAAQGAEILPEAAPLPAAEPSLVADLAPLIDFEQAAALPPQTAARDDWADFLSEAAAQPQPQPQQQQQYCGTSADAHAVPPPQPPRAEQLFQAPPSFAAPAPPTQPPLQPPAAPPYAPAAVRAQQHAGLLGGALHAPQQPAASQARPVAQAIPMLPPPPK